MGLTILVWMVDCFIFGYAVGLHKTRKGGVVVSGVKKRVLLVSIDGFRFDYIMRGKTPHIAALGRKSVVIVHL